MMDKKVLRFYSMFLDKQEAFLNKMADEGWKLIKTTKLSYEFTPCEPKEYEYSVIFIGEKSYKKNLDLQSFFKDMGYEVFTKNANLNYSIGKIRWRPYGEKSGQLTTSPGSFNKEILIIEKKRDDKPFKIFSTNEDMAEYYGVIRNVYINLLILAAFLIALSLWQNFSQMILLILGGLICVILMIPIVNYTKKIQFYKNLAMTEE